MDYKVDYRDRYNRLLDAIKELQKANPSDDGIQNWINDNVPELSESDDERIRKSIIAIINNYVDNSNTFKHKMLAWLEKQDNTPKEVTCTQEVEVGNGNINALVTEKIIIDKVEPKFKVGDTIINIHYRWDGKSRIREITDGKYIFEEGSYIDINEQDSWELVGKNKPKFSKGEWITNGEDVWQIDEVKTENYLLVDSEGNLFAEEIATIDSEFHLWNITDARDGDVLMANAPFIFNGNLDGGIGCPGAYCAINTLGNFQIPNKPTHWTGHNTYPATKEQRDTLMKAMTDAGYTFDFEKKELKESEQKSLQWNISDYKTWQYIVSDVLTLHDGIGQYLDDGFCKNIAKNMQEEWSKKLSLGQKSTWGKEDEQILKAAILHIKNETYNCYGGYSSEDILQWLKSFRPQPKQEWSEEDEKMLKNVILDLQVFRDKDSGEAGKAAYQREIDWLKSLRPQNTWKPSDEQIDAIRLARSFVVDDFSEHQTLSEILIELEEQLKKLKG